MEDKSFLKKHWKKILILILGIAVLIIIGASFKLNGTDSIKNLFTLKKGLENTYYLSQILCSFIVIIGGIVAVGQYVLAKDIERKKFHNARVQKAIDLSEYYKDNILCNMTFIYAVYEELNILDILDSVKIEDMKEFDTAELNRIFKSDQIKNMADKLKSVDLIKTVQKLSEIYATENNRFGKEILVFEEDGVRRVQGVNISRIYEEFINNTVMETLNNLEYFALHFVYGTADKYVVYQSLHVTYLDIVRLLYYNIAKNNNTGEQKLFTNVIELFNIWKQMAEEQKQAEVQASRNSIIKGKSAKNIE